MRLGKDACTNASFRDQLCDYGERNPLLPPKGVLGGRGGGAGFPALGVIIEVKS